MLCINLLKPACLKENRPKKNKFLYSLPTGALRHYKEFLDGTKKYNSAFQITSFSAQTIHGGVAREIYDDV